jgi:osmotically-inducible protein OsmY
VVGLDERGEVQVLGGFADTSLDTVEVDESTLGPGAGDWALAEAIERELREDASTTDLNVRVRVYRGVAHLSGRISGPEDAENAESVAASVPGVREVVDELEVEA